MSKEHGQVNKIDDVALWSHYQLEDSERFAIGHMRQGALFSAIRRRLQSGKLLEIGFGDCYLLRLLAPHYECHGADISPDIVEHMARELPTVRFAVAGADGRLPYADESFDMFVASEVLEHMNDQQLDRTISEMLRVLKPGGRALVTFPARENLDDNQCYCPNCGTTFHKWGHKQRWDEEKIRKTFCKFTIESIEERYFVGSTLNLFGKIEAYARIALSKVRQVSNMTFVVTLRK